MIPPRIALLNSDGSTDTSFDPGEGLNAAGRAVAVLASGQIAAGGDFTQADGVARSRFAVFNPDGSLDGINPGANAAVRFIIPQTDGKAIIGGAFSQFDGLTRGRLARLQSDLSTDAAFSPAFNGTLNAAALQAGGKIVTVGAFTAVGATARNRIARLYNDDAATLLKVESASTVTWKRTGAGQGAERVSFEIDTGSGYTALGGTVAKTLDGWQVTGLTLSGDGSIRARAFPTDGHSQGTIEEIAAFDFVPVLQVSIDETVLDELGEVNFGTVQIGKTAQQSFLFTNVGLTDLTFEATGATLSGTNADQWGFTDPGHTLTPGASASFILAFTPTSAGSKTAAINFFTDDAGSPFTVNLEGIGVAGPGSIDTSFAATLGGSDGRASSQVLALSVSDTGAAIGGLFTSVNSQTRNRFARVTATGSLELQSGAGANDTVQAIAALPDGKWMIAGAFTRINGAVRNRLARLNADRTLDTSFNVAANGTIYCLLVQDDGSLIVGGDFTQLGGKARAGLGKITSSGALDAGWISAPAVGARCMAFAPDGKIYVGGSFSGGMMRLSAAGLLDSTYDAGLAAGVRVSALTVDAGGKVIYASSTVGAAPTLKRTLTTGADDATISTSLVPYSLATQADGKILVGRSDRVSRISAAGDDDTVFAGAELDTVRPLRIALAPDGGIYAAGTVLHRILSDIGAAESALSVESPTSAQWLRGGTAPEAQYVVFDLSEDNGGTWARLGKGVRITGGWSIATNLPIAGQVRARAYIGTSNGSGAFHDELVAFSGLAAPNIQVEYPAGTALTNGGDFQFPAIVTGQNLSVNLTIRNTGSAVLSGLALTSSSSEWVVTSLGLTSLEPNQTTTATIRFSPAVLGYRTGSLSIASNVAGLKNPLILALKGSSIGLPTAETNAESAVTSMGATINGKVKPNHDTATAFFQYKRVVDSVWITVGSGEVSGFSIISRSFVLTGLTPATNYHSRMGVYNSVNTSASPVFGRIDLFSTLPA